MGKDTGFNGTTKRMGKSMSLANILPVHILAFATGFLLDQLLGDPAWVPHPVRGIGRLITGLERRLLDRQSESGEHRAGQERRNGALLVVVVLAIVLLLTAVLVIASYRLSVWVGFLVEAVLLCTCFAAADLRRESMAVHQALQKNDLVRTRQALSRIVGRQTEALTKEEICKAAVETVSENLSDGVIAPMCYAALGGPVLAMGYKAINTMDSMLGYRTERYRFFGTAAARLDDAVNFLPARISAILLILACWFDGKESNARHAWQIWQRDRNLPDSPNAGQPESACAGALGIALGGDAVYFGEPVEKPILGDATRPTEPEDIVRCNRLAGIASVIWAIVCVCLMLVVWKVL